MITDAQKSHLVFSFKIYYTERQLENGFENMKYRE